MKIEKCCKNCKYMYNDNHGLLITDYPHYQCTAYIKESFSKIKGTVYTIPECHAVIDECTKFEFTNRLKFKLWFNKFKIWKRKK